MYLIVSTISIIIRTITPLNPFAPLGPALSDGLGYLFSGFIGALAYFFVGLFYDRGDNSIIGALLFVLFYFLNNFVIWLICLSYPITWLIVVVTLLYLGLIAVAAIRFRFVI